MRRLIVLMSRGPGRRRRRSYGDSASVGFDYCVPVPEQSWLPYVWTLFCREALVEPPGVSFIRWAKRDAFPLAIAQLELKPHVVFARTFTHVAAAFLPPHYEPVRDGVEPL